MKIKKPNNVYEFICSVTGIRVGTNPKQFSATLARYRVSSEVLKKSYISREGRQIIKEAGLTAEQVCEKYGVDMAIASKLKHLPKVRNISIEVPVTAIAEIVEPPHNNDRVVEPNEIFYDASKEDACVSV